MLVDEIDLSVSEKYSFSSNEVTHHMPHFHLE